MKKTLCKILVLIASVSFAQKTYTNTYNVDTVYNAKYSFDDSHVIFEYDKSFYTIGTFEENRENALGVVDGISDTTHSMVMKFDLNGNLQYTNFYTPNSCTSNIYNYFQNASNLIGIGTILSSKNFCGFYDNENVPPGIDEDIKYRIFLTLTDLPTGNYKQKIYRTGVSSYPFGIVKSNDGNFFVGNLVEKDRSICLLKINASLDSLSNKILFDSVPSNYEPTFFDKTESGYIIVFVSQIDNASHIQFLNSNVDTTGFVNHPFVILSISKTSDQGYICVTNETPANSRVIKFDKKLSVEWSKNFPVYGNSFIKQTKDGNYIMGNKDFAKICKDSVIWKRRYFGEGNITPWYFLFDATETSDGGIALTGFYDANTLLVKTDCMGNLVWDSGCTPIISDTVKPEAVYPNPFSEKITFQFTNLTEYPFTIRIINPLGQVIFEQEVINNIVTLNTSSLSSGVYIYTVQTGKKMYKSGKIIKP